MKAFQTHMALTYLTLNFLLPTAKCQTIEIHNEKSRQKTSLTFCRFSNQENYCFSRIILVLQFFGKTNVLKLLIGDNDDMNSEFHPSLQDFVPPTHPCRF